MREHESREPFAYIIQDKYERERGVEGHLSRSHVSKYVSQEDINEHEITCTPLYRHAQQPVALDGLIKAVEFYEQVKRENPPVETGAWKDAVDWVLKEACRAARLNGGKS